MSSDEEEEVFSDDELETPTQPKLITFKITHDTTHAPDQTVYSHHVLAHIRDELSQPRGDFLPMKEMRHVGFPIHTPTNSEGEFYTEDELRAMGLDHCAGPYERMHRPTDPGEDQASLVYMLKEVEEAPELLWLACGTKTNYREEFEYSRAMLSPSFQLHFVSAMFVNNLLEWRACYTIGPGKVLIWCLENNRHLDEIKRYQDETVAYLIKSQEDGRKEGRSDFSTLMRCFRIAREQKLFLHILGVAWATLDMKSLHDMGMQHFAGEKMNPRMMDSETKAIVWYAFWRLSKFFRSDFKDRFKLENVEDDKGRPLVTAAYVYDNYLQ
jgi:hypothetical protein